MIEFNHKQSCVNKNYQDKNWRDAVIFQALEICGGGFSKDWKSGAEHGGPFRNVAGCWVSDS
jgi:hypothetical protein